VCGEVGLTAKEAPSDGATGLQGWGIRSVELQVILPIPILPWLVVSLSVDLERALLLAGYGTLWVTFGVL
jgi:hypothetical protein